MSRQTATADVNSLFRFVLKLFSPETLGKMFPRLFKTYCRGADATVVVQGPDFFEGQLTRFSRGSAAAHKFTFNGAVTPSPGLSINTSASLLTERIGYLSGDEAGVPQLGVEPPLLLLNLFVSYQLPLAKGFQVAAGVYNLLDARVLYVQPYTGGHAPLPGASREVIARLSYRYAFD